ncbi:30S ribosomal protein S9 [Methanolobus zinderi]|jgi:small subunit ribosomal protein S9|uniref:Small ribosomal subunit protein uS9 n=1 Tax=Methanolobus zinderi TaxID=536044 RepID=A0A7D5INX8_9EURY|nr:30S ribosomal protein S9 [Methanolobus zinderi]KXS40148.1 MAG: SSU ribosomal protein S9P [Methanolobus sp. T82-4]QLC49527.1 30S ribosomal protein S9 [Methanolobus zinderi]
MSTKIVTTSGKKKTAIARATVKKGTGKVRINKKPLEIYDPEFAKQKIDEAVMVAGETASTLDIDVTVSGGGIMGQANAIRTAIARGIVDWTNDTEIRDTYMEYDRNLLVNDSRQKETKKFGGPGARSKYQKSYR